MSTSPAYPTRLRQIALLTAPHSLPLARHLLTTIFATPVIYTDPGVAQWGLSNFLVPLGGDIIEVVAPLLPGGGSAGGRLLMKRARRAKEGKGKGRGEGDEEATGEGGYMLILQTADAAARRKEIEERLTSLPSNLSSQQTESEARFPRNVIFSHPFSHQYPTLPNWAGHVDQGWCIQYHPSLPFPLPGGVIPELDSHTPCPPNEDPVRNRFGPWHACGPDYAGYVKGMKGTGHLFLLRVVLRVRKGERGGVGVGVGFGAAEIWGRTFGIEFKDGELRYTNCVVGFEEGGQGEGLESVTVGVQGTEELEGIVRRARQEGVWNVSEENERGWIEMVGVRWYLKLMDGGSLRARI